MVRLGLSPLNAHKHAYNFQNNTQFCRVCGCTEDTEHYLLKCKSYALSRTTMLNNISLITKLDMSTLPRKRVISILLYGNEDLTNVENSKILKEVVKFISLFKRLDTLTATG